MNYARVALAGVVAWIVFLPISYIVNDILLKGIYTANAAALRPEADVMGNLPIGFFFSLIGFLVFAYAYAKGYEGTNGVMEGIRYGVVVALMIICFGTIWYYVTVPINGTMVTAMMVDIFVEWIIYGAIVGAIYKPAAARARALT